MRRSFAGLFFGAAFLCACLAISGFLLQRTLFSPGNAKESTEAIMSDGVLRQEFVDVISQGVAPQLGISADDAAAVVKQVVSTRAGAHLLGNVLRDAHAHLIGDSSAPVRITGDQMAQIARDEGAAASPDVTLQVPRLGLLVGVKDIVGWMVPLACIGIIVFLVLCFLAHPERAALVRTSGLGMLVLAALVGIFGYVVPKFLPTLATDSVWGRVPSGIADDDIAGVISTCIVFAGLGLALFAASARMGRSRRWSTPISTYRYREERRWS